MSGSSSQVKYGAIFSYLLMILNALYGIIFIPFVIKCVGQGDYGVYKSISSLTHSLAVIDLGIGGTATRYISGYIAKKEKEKIPNFVAMCFAIVGLLCSVATIVAFAGYFLLDPVYQESFTHEQIDLAKHLYMILGFSAVLSIFENLLHGIIGGYNRFGFSNGCKLLLLVIRIALLVILLNATRSVMTIVKIGCLVTVLTIVIEFIYIRFRIQLKIKYKGWDNAVFLEAGKYTLLMFLTAIVSQINSNLDNVVIGAIRGAGFVTIYSVGLTFFGMFQNLSSGVAGVMLPSVTNTLHEENGMKKVVPLIIKAGRVQFTLLGAALIGFICIGRQFISLWLGSSYEDAYLITLLLIAPAIFELVVNVCLSVLRAKNLISVRTIIITVTAVINAIVTILLVKTWSYIGAAFGTAIGYIIGSIILSNLYYHKALGFDMLHIYKSIFRKILPCQLLSGVVLYVYIKIVTINWTSIVGGIVLFCIIYFACLICYGYDKEDKNVIFGRILKRVKGRN